MKAARSLIFITLPAQLILFSPKDFGYQRNRSCSELLAIKTNLLTGLNGSAPTSSMVTSYGHCLAQARADLTDKRPSLSVEKTHRCLSPCWESSVAITDEPKPSR